MATDHPFRDSFVEGIELERSADGGDVTAITGYAAVFNQETVMEQDGLRWREKVSPTAFTEALQRDDVVAVVNHDHSLLLGRTKSGTLKLTSDSRGLRYRVELSNTAVSRDTVTQIQRGDLAGSSFKFRVAKGGMRLAERPGPTPDDLPLLVMERVKLIDVGPVTFPAYEGTSVGVRSVPSLVEECYREQQVQPQYGAESTEIKIVLDGQQIARQIVPMLPISVVDEPGSPLADAKRRIALARAKVV